MDGKHLKPILDRTSFVKTTMIRTYFIYQPKRLLLNTAMLGVVVTYLTDHIPHKVTVTPQEGNPLGMVFHTIWIAVLNFGLLAGKVCHENRL